MRIEIGKSYQTAGTNARVRRILCTDGPGEYCVVAEMEGQADPYAARGSDAPCRWVEFFTLDGRSRNHPSAEFNLIESPREYSGWLVFALSRHEDGELEVFAFSSGPEAKEFAEEISSAVGIIPYRFIEGEGLEKEVPECGQ